MSSAPGEDRVRRFACTQCGACCDRPPEVELSEAAALADMFVFRLLFRLYELPRTLSGCPASLVPAGGPDEFYESKRLLNAFAARKHRSKERHGGQPVELTKYLTVSVLAVDTGSGACPALRDGRCEVYDSRPLACRTVPFHYSRPEGSAERYLASFVATRGYRCDTSAEAPVVIEGGRIVDPGARQARAEALEMAERDRRWKDAILREVKVGSGRYPLPSLGEIATGSLFGAMTTSMRVAWQIAAEAGLISAETCTALIAAQTTVIDRELSSARCAPAARQTLADMRAEYRELPQAALGAS